MGYWGEYKRRRERSRLAKARTLARAEREVREAFAPLEGRAGPWPIEVRWGLPDDEARIAELLELNGMPRWVAFEERFIVAEQDGASLAAVRYRTRPKQLLLGLLVVDPWAGRSTFGERRLAVTLYAGARSLALELGAGEIVAKIDRPRADYLYEAGYRRCGGGWRLDPTQPAQLREELPAGGWRRWLHLMGAFVPALLLPKRHSREL